MTQIGRITQRSVRLSEVFEPGIPFEVAVGGLHRHHAVLHLAQKRDGILAGEERVAGIVLHPEERGVDLIDNLEEDLAALGEFGIAPETVFVVIFHAKSDAARGGIFQAGADSLDSPPDTILQRRFRMALP